MSPWSWPLVAVATAALCGCAPEPRPVPVAPLPQEMPTAEAPTPLPAVAPSVTIAPMPPSPPLPRGPSVGPGALAFAGRQVFRRERGEHELKELVVTDDGFLAVGHAQFGGTLDTCVARFDLEGRLDPTFGQGGVVRVGARGAFGTNVALDARGRILVAGYFYAPGQAENLVLARLTPDGAADPTFGGTGAFTLDLGGSDDRPSSIVPLPTGGLVVVGIHSIRGTNEYETYLAKFGEDGQPDASFGRGGFQTVDVLPGREFGNRALLDRDGSILIGGYRVMTHQGGFVARVTAAGELDRSFADGGAVVFPAIESAWALAIDERSRPMLGGQTTDGRAVVVRLLPDGRADPAWTGGGFGPTGGDDQLYAILPGADGAVVGVGFRGLASDARSMVLRWSAAGVLEPSTGMVLGPAGDIVLDAAVDPSGGLIGVGMATRGDEIVGLVTRFAPR